jgi:hypothetical protein
MMIRCYRHLIRLNTFEERYEYLKLAGIIGETTFGYDRYLNQLLYKSDAWKKTRRNIIIRDKSCDLAMEGYDLYTRVIVHHINAITIEDVELDRDIVYDPENLISTCLNTHNAIHYGDKTLLPKLPIERRRNDTCPWK